MENSNSYDPIEDLKKRLYERGSGVSKRSRTNLTRRQEKIKQTWTDSPRAKKVEKYFASSFLTKLLIGSFIFFVGALGVSGFILWKGSNVVSNQNINLTINGPATTKAGDEVSFQIVIANGNSVSLEEVELEVDYPDGTILADGLNKNGRVRESIGTIKSGETVNKTTKAILFGQENTEKEVMVTLEYRIPGSNAYYEKKIIQKLVINSPPIDISINTLPEVVSGQTSVLEVTLASNAETPLKNIILVASYPRGFDFEQANITPSLVNNVWKLGDISPGEKKTIKIEGLLEGQDEEIKNFTFSVGGEDEITSGRIATLYNEKINTVIIKRPFVNANLVVNGKTLPESNLASGELIRVDVGWVNNLATPIVDAEIEVSIDGTIFDEESVSPGRGFYRSSDNKILWNKTRLPELAEIAPGESGDTSFTFSTHRLSSASAGSVRNPEIHIDMVMNGTRVSQGFGGEVIKSTATHVVKIQSDLQLATRAVHTVGPFENSGTIPPRANVETTYTVIWSISNSSNRIEEAEVKALLPPSVRFIGLVKPASENITFDEGRREITWRVGGIEALIGGAGSVKEVAFQLGLTPSINDVGQAPKITEPATLTGKDSFTGTTITSLADSITTRITSDPGFTFKDAVVIK